MHGRVAPFETRIEVSKLDLKLTLEYRFFRQYIEMEISMIKHRKRLTPRLSFSFNFNLFLEPSILLFYTTAKSLLFYFAFPFASGVAKCT